MSEQDEKHESFREWLWRQAETAQRRADTDPSKKSRDDNFNASLLLFGVLQEYDRRGGPQ